MAWFEPQLCQDAIKASTRNERERLYARGKRAENLIEKLVRPRSRGNPGEHFIEVSRGRRILIRHRPPPPASSGLIIAPASYMVIDTTDLDVAGIVQRIQGATPEVCAG